MTAVLAAAAAIGSKQLFEKLIRDLADVLQKKALTQYKKWRSTKGIQDAYRIANKLRKVKTIWQLDKPIDLKTFYCDPYIQIQGKRRIVHSLEDLPPNSNMLIEGIAGQGKSMLLRHLCANELTKGDYLPIIIELRKVNNSTPLKGRIFAAFESLGLELDEAAFAAVATTGRIAIFLDAFDEIEESYRGNAVNDIEELVERYPQLRIIITSRPHQSIKASRHFIVATLDFMRGKEYESVVTKLSDSEELSESLIRYIDQEGKAVKGLLITPLFVTLFVLAFKHGIRPKRLSEFYHDLQTTLLARHDGTKPGYVRKRTCGLYNDVEFAEVFDTVCIITMQSRKQSFSQKEVYETAKKAISQCGLKLDARAYIEDVVKITCLLVNEGDEYRFIHQTVKEYNAASYISRRPDSWAREFYSRLANAENQFAWNEVVRFLTEIDPYRFNKYFYLPLLERDLGLTEDKIRAGHFNVTKEMGKTLLEGIYVACIKTKDAKGYETRVMAEPPRYYARDLMPELFKKLDFGSIGQAIEAGRHKGLNPLASDSGSRGLPRVASRTGPYFHFYPLKEFYVLGVLKGIDSFLSDFITRIAKTMRMALEEVRSQESTDVLKGLL